MVYFKLRIEFIRRTAATATQGFMAVDEIYIFKYDGMKLFIQK